jgi:cell wall-associated NlpC family hydrolase
MPHLDGNDAILTTRKDKTRDRIVARGMRYLHFAPQIAYSQARPTQIKLGRAVTLAAAKPGDVVFYGPSTGNPTHEALYLGNNKVLSNGHHPMQIYPVDYRSDRIAVRSFLPAGK